MLSLLGDEKYLSKAKIQHQEETVNDGLWAITTGQHRFIRCTTLLGNADDVCEGWGEVYGKSLHFAVNLKLL